MFFRQRNKKRRSKSQAGTSRTISDKSKTTSNKPYSTNGQVRCKQISNMEPGDTLEFQHEEINVQDENITPNVEIPGKKIVRRKQRDVTNWKMNKRAKSYQAGEAYVSRRGVLVPERKIKELKDCVSKCRFKCGITISKTEREAQFVSYYKMKQNEKYHYLLRTTERSLTERPKDRNRESYKKFSYKFFFYVGADKVQVCKKFFLGTLAISQKPVYHVHSNKDTLTNMPKADCRGKNPKSRRALSEEVRARVRDHIMSFPKVESHYCRATTNRQYLEPNLNLVKMYNMYTAHCEENNENPVPLSMYRHIFVTQFNLDFHARKSDRCDVCEEYRVASAQKIVSQEKQLLYETHVKEKDAMRQNRQKDRDNKEVPVLCFDLENVISCPRAEISSFFYKRKLNTYNLTAHFSDSKTIYCALWTEAISGRSGNDLASAMYKILTRVEMEHDISELILWSDSCVPQNRNSYISCAVMNFLHANPQISKITMKYSVPGHSCIQEVDNAHSQIEKAMNVSEFYSPLGLIRILKSLNRNHPVRVLQMNEKDFFDFASSSKHLNFKLVPFFQVSTISFCQTLHEVTYSTSFLESAETKVNLRFVEKPSRKSASTKRSEGNVPIWQLLAPENLKCKPTLPEDKIKDIKSMFKFMPLQDREFYTVVLKI